ncbi:DUF465 domain-containing protein [Aquibium sp. A9E412]|uniref:DUF465 domain-containing protein n=1 Tax=Aquibium sp. A9E412 TaxID=2976767 RepID=UPI0025B03C60|nr:DUF465 domain-containing protein [Aquibium sp. A9E412]MDN2568247.1 DUF465 domain-containing protein [Aquibium sp. A9E412]
MNPLLKSLRTRHDIVQAKIDAEQSRPRPDSLRIMALKKIRLGFREQIEFLERRDDKPPVMVVRRRAPRQVVRDAAR